LVAIGVLVATGSAMAAHFDRWSDTTLQVKLGLVGVVAVLVLWHLRRPTMHALEAAIFVFRSRSFGWGSAWRTGSRWRTPDKPHVRGLERARQDSNLRPRD
jgi:hypothetical protein